MKISKSPGFFSIYRWSPGSIIIVIMLSIMILLLLWYYIIIHSITLLILSFLILAVEIFIIMLKGFEIVTLVENHENSYINKKGIALQDFTPGTPGVVKIDNELWSAYSEEYIKKGDPVIVIKQDGIYLRVKKL